MKEGSAVQKIPSESPELGCYHTHSSSLRYEGQTTFYTTPYTHAVPNDVTYVFEDLWSL